MTTPPGIRRCCLPCVAAVRARRGGAVVRGRHKRLDYPNRTIRIVVPIPPGPTADVLPRIIGEKLTAKWGQPVIVENRPGAALNLGAEAVAQGRARRLHAARHAAGTAGHQSARRHASLDYDPTAFVPMTIMGALPSTLVAHPSLPVSTLAQLIAYARANPDKVTYATSGIGSPQHLATMMLEAAAGVRMIHVPYRGMAPAMTDILAGHVQLMFDNLGNTRDHIKENRLKLLGGHDRTPHSAIPRDAGGRRDVPGRALHELVRAGRAAQDAAGNRRQAACGDREVLQMPDVVRRLAAMSVSPGGMSPLETTALIKDESERWRKIIQATGIKSE